VHTAEMYTNSPGSNDFNHRDAFHQMDALQAAGLVVNKRRTAGYADVLGPVEVYTWDVADRSCGQTTNAVGQIFPLIVGLPEFTAVTGISQKDTDATVEVEISVKLTDCYKRFNQAIVSSSIPVGVGATPLRDWNPNLNFPTRHQTYGFKKYDDGWRVGR